MSVITVQLDAPDIPDTMKVIIDGTTFNPPTVLNQQLIRVVVDTNANLIYFQSNAPTFPTFDTIALVYDSICFFNNYQFILSILIDNVTFVLQPGNYVTYTLPNGPFGEQSDTPCCVHGNTIIETSKGKIEIKNLTTDNKIYVKDLNGDFIKVIYNIKFIPSNKFIRIKKHAFGINRPDNDLLIREGHPIFIDGKEIQPVNIIDNNNILFDNIFDRDWTYSLCTKTRTFVLMNNIPVCTWEENEWLNTTAKKVYWLKQ